MKPHLTSHQRDGKSMITDFSFLCEIPFSALVYKQTAGKLLYYYKHL